MNRFIVILIIGLSLRLFLIPQAVHPDLRGFNLAAYLIAQKGEALSFYDHISRLPRDHHWVSLYTDGLFIYPPLAYLTPAVFNFLLWPLYPQSTFWQLINDMGQVLSGPDTWLLMYLLKLPYLVAEIAGLWLLSKYLDPKHKLFGLSLWWLNPLNIYSSYLIGQFDIFITVVLLAAVLVAKSKSSAWAAVLVGVAAGFKPFPLVLLPFLPGNLLKNTAIGLGVYLAIIGPYLGSAGFKNYALLAGLTDKIVYAKVMVSGSQYLSLFFVGLFLLAWLRYYRPDLFSLPGWWLAVLVLFYSVTHFHPQWFIWASSLFVVVAAVNRRTWLPLMVMLGCYIFIVLSFEPSLHFGLFGLPIMPLDLLGRFMPVDQLVSLVRSGMAATGLVLLIQLAHARKS